MVESLRRFDPATQRSTGATDQVLIVPVRERFDDEPESTRLRVSGGGRGVKLLDAEYEQVDEQASKVRAQLEVSYGDAAARGHVVARPPAEAFVRWDDIAARVEHAPRLEELAIDMDASDAVDAGGNPPALPSGSPDGRSAAGFPPANIRHISASPRSSLRARERLGRRPAPGARARRHRPVHRREPRPRRARRRESSGVRHRRHPGRAGRRRAPRSVLVAVEIVVARLSVSPMPRCRSTSRTTSSKKSAALRRAAQARARRFSPTCAISKVGDLVVHVDHWHREFVGLKQLGWAAPPTAGVPRTPLSRRGQAICPGERLDLIQK